MPAPLNKNLFPNYTDLKAQRARAGAACIYPSRACVDVGEDHGYMVFNHGLHLDEIKGTSKPSKKDAQFNLGVSISLNYTFRYGYFFNKVVCQKGVPFEEIIQLFSEMHHFDEGRTHFSVWKDHIRHLFKLYFLMPYPWSASRSSRFLVRPRNLHCNSSPEDSE